MIRGCAWNQQRSMGRPMSLRYMTLTFGQDLPLARLAPVTCRDLGSQLIKQMLHFCPPLAFGQLVACSQRRRPTVWCYCVRRVAIPRYLADSFALQRVVMGATRHVGHVGHVRHWIIWQEWVSTKISKTETHSGAPTIFESVLAMRQLGIASHDATPNRRMFTVSPRQNLLPTSFLTPT